MISFSALRGGFHGEGKEMGLQSVKCVYVVAQNARRS